MSGNLLNTFLFNIKGFNSYVDTSIKGEPGTFIVSNFGIPLYTEVTYNEIQPTTPQVYVDIETTFNIMSSLKENALNILYDGDINTDIKSTYSMYNTNIIDAQLDTCNIQVNSTPIYLNKEVGIQPSMFANSTYMQTAVYKERPTYYQDYNMHTTYMYPIGGMRVSKVNIVYLDDIDYIISSTHRNSATVISSPTLLPLHSQVVYSCEPSNIAAAYPVQQDILSDVDTTIYLLYSFMPEEFKINVDQSAWYEVLRGILPEEVTTTVTSSVLAINLLIGLASVFMSEVDMTSNLSFMASGNPAIVVRSWFNVDETYGTIFVPTDPYI